MEFYTKHQTLRGTKPDAEIGNKIYLIKNVSQLRLTYQIRMLTYMAQTRGMRLAIRIPKSTVIHQSLLEFVLETNDIIIFERT